MGALTLILMASVAIGAVTLAGSVLNSIGATAHAMKIDSGDNKQIFFDDKGKQLSALEAYKAAMEDKKVLQCSYVEAIGNSRTGKVNLKKVR